MNIVRVVAIYLIADALNLVFTGALRGAGDVKFIMIATTATVATTVALIFVGIKYYHMGVYWCWWLQTSYLVANSLIFYVRLFFLWISFCFI